MLNPDGAFLDPHVHGVFFQVKMAVVHQTNVIMAQPMPMAVGNPKLMGSVHGVREWSSGLCGCMSDCMSGTLK